MKEPFETGEEFKGMNGGGRKHRSQTARPCLTQRAKCVCVFVS